MSGAAVITPPTPSAPPSSRAMRTCFLNATRASSSGVCPAPASLTHAAACGPKRSAAASAMYSGARSRLRQELVPQPLRRALELIDLGCGLHSAGG